MSPSPRSERQWRCPYCAAMFPFGTLNARRHLAACIAYRFGPAVRAERP